MILKHAEGISKIKSVSEAITGFGGIRKGGSAKKGSLYDSYNLTGGAFTSLRPRGRRAVIRTCASADGIFGDDTLAYVDGGKLYYGGLEVSGIYLTSGEKNILKLGKYLLIFPDEVYYNTSDPTDFGAMSVSFSAESGRICCVNSSFEEISYTAVTKEPDGAAVGEYCAVQGTDGSFKMKRFDGTVWNVCESYLKISAAGIGAGIKAGDTVECTEMSDAVGNAFTVIARASDALYCEGIVASALTLGAFTVSRTVPVFDHAAVSGGRLCGVRRGRDKSGQLVCRMYASAENDPFVFSPEGGGALLELDISGAFTGICDYLGSPVAFSENDIVEARIKNGALIASVIKSYGVEEGAHKSTVSANGVLYYKSSVGVCRYDGSYPECISKELGGISVGGNGCPAMFGSGKYYIKLTDNESQTAIYVYNSEEEVWHRENDPGVKAFAKRHENIYALTDSGEIVLMDYDSADVSERTYCSADGYPLAEEKVLWSFESAEISADTFKSVCPIRLNVRMNKSAENSVSLGVIFDGGNVGAETEVEKEVFGAVNIPIPLKRCDTLRLRMSGEGECEIKGLMLEYRTGGESRAWR